MKRLMTVVALLTAGLILGLASLVYREPDHERGGGCTATDIDRTYAALEELHKFRDAAHQRIFAVWSKRAHPYSVRERLALGVSAHLAGITSRRQTAAFACNHAYVRLGEAQPYPTLKAAAKALGSLTGDEPKAWRLAACLSWESYSPAFQELNVANMERVCRVRTERNLRQ